MQSKLNSNYYLAATLKNNFPHLKIYTILSHLSDSEVLDQRKYCKSDKIKIRGKKIKTAKYCGAVNSRELDGDSESEKVKGIEELSKYTKSGYIRTIDIHKIPDSLSTQLYYIDYAENKNPNKISIDDNLKTLDYYQALIFIKGSKPNTPYEITYVDKR